MPCPWKSPWHPLTPPVRSWTQAVFATGILSTCPWYLLFVSRLLNQVNKKVLNTDLIFLYLFKWTFDKIHWEYVHGKQKKYPCAFLDCDFLSLDLIVIINKLFEARTVYNIPIFLSVQIYFKPILSIRFESMAPEQMTCTIVTHNRLYREIFRSPLGCQ